MAEFKVAEEVAEEEFARMLEAFELTELVAGTIARSAENNEAYQDSKLKIILALRDGSLVINAEGFPVFTPKLGDQKPITFPEPNGSIRKAMDQVKQGKGVEKGFAVMAKWTGHVQARFEQMKQRDLRVCESLYGLFLL